VKFIVLIIYLKSIDISILKQVKKAGFINIIAFAIIVVGLLLLKSQTNLI